jgi:hypothetical protein
MTSEEFSRLVAGQQEWGKSYRENRKIYKYEKQKEEKRRWKENQNIFRKIYNLNKLFE